MSSLRIQPISGCTGESSFPLLPIGPGGSARPDSVAPWDDPPPERIRNPLPPGPERDGPSHYLKRKAPGPIPKGLPATSESIVSRSEERMADGGIPSSEKGSEALALALTHAAILLDCS